jgi:hypothetical protein
VALGKEECPDSGVTSVLSVLLVVVVPLALVLPGLSWEQFGLLRSVMIPNMSPVIT